MSCPNCGSWAVKADRSLGGRMVCGRCGQPLGAKVIPLRRHRRRLRWQLSGAPRGGWGLLLLALLVTSGLLAALQPTAPQERRRLPLPARLS